MRVRSTIVVATLLVAVFDIWTPISLIGCTLYTLPLAFCAMQRSKVLLWGTAIAATILTLIAARWGVERSAPISLSDALLNRGLVIASFFTLTAFVHLWIDGRLNNDAVAEARRMEERFRRLLESAPDAMVITDANGIIQLVNQQAERIFGYSKEEMQGQGVELLIPAHLSGRHEMQRAQFAKDPKFRMIGQGLELQGRRKDGSEFPVEIALSPLQMEGDMLVSAAVRDITERKQTQEALQQSEMRVRSILDNAYNAFVGMDDQGLITEWNSTAETMFGWTRQEILGRSLADMIIPPVHREAHRRGMAHFLATGEGPVLNKRIEISAIRRDASEFPIELSIRALKFQGVYTFNAFIADITDQKRTLDAQQHLVAILQSSSDAIISRDVNGIITSWNPGAERLLGYTREEVIGKHIELLFPPDKRSEERAMDERVVSGGAYVEHFETFRQRKDGSLVEVSLTVSPIRNEKGEITGASKFAHDITSRKKAEREIRELNRTLEHRVEERTEELLKSEKRYHDALDIMMEGVQIIGFDWRYIYVNDSLVRQSTYTREQLVGYTMMEKYPGIEHSALFTMLRGCMAERTARVMENQFTFPNGTMGIFHLSIQPVNEGLLILSTDITQRKRAELEVMAQREQLERANKELEQFAYIASHDLQEPLRMVTSYVELLQRRYGDKLDVPAKEFIGYAVDGAHRMKRLINDLLTYSRLGRAAKVEDVDMNVILKQVRSNLSASIAESGATVEVEQLPQIRASQTEMVQVFQNLVSNAVKFRQDHVLPEIRVSGKEERDHWSFVVRDNGIGIDEQYAKQVFVPFKRLHDKSKYTGSGIGLAVAQKIIQRYGGRIWFDSAPGQGTTFHFTIKRTTT